MKQLDQNRDNKNVRKKDRESKAPGETARLHIDDFYILRDLIHEKTGIYFQDNKRHVLQSRIAARLDALLIVFFEEYLEYIANPLNIREVFRLIDAVTSTETAFFRDSNQFDFIQHQLLPALVKKKKKQGHSMIRIWSTACSTGEEPYSLAMVVNDHLKPAYPDISFQIIGSDINTSVLKAAECGVFKSKALSSLPASMIEKHFSAIPEGYLIHSNLQSKVQFKRINLADRTDMMRMHAVDLVLCTHVLHAFSQESREKTLCSIYNSMGEEGYLMIGSGETLYGLNHPFIEFTMNCITVFQKCA